MDPLSSNSTDTFNIGSKLALQCGSDTQGKDYSSIDDMWREELKDRVEDGGKASLGWYKKAAEYWDAESNCEASVNGVLGGYGHISPVDILGSSRFLGSVAKLRSSFNMTDGRAVDCGAGIGRVTKLLLLPRFRSVDLVEQSSRLLRAAPGYIGPDAQRVGHYLNVGLQSFIPDDDGYDCFWIQWVIGHLTDADMISFLRFCKQKLRPGGILVVKENICRDEAFVVDKSDSSVTRSADYFKQLFATAGVRLVLEQKQEGFPSDIFDVHMFALD